MWMNFCWWDLLSHKSASIPFSLGLASGYGQVGRFFILLDILGFGTQLCGYGSAAFILKTGRAAEVSLVICTKGKLELLVDKYLSLA